MLKSIAHIRGIRYFSYICKLKNEGKRLCALEPHNRRASFFQDISSSRES